MNRLFILFIASFFMFSCEPENTNSKQEVVQPTIQNGEWKFSFISQKTEIPIRVSISTDSLIIHNAQESISLVLEIINDSFFVAIPNFDSHIEGIIQSSTQLKGVFIKDYADDYSIPFLAAITDGNVFETNDLPPALIKNRYDVEIINGEKKSNAIGLFKQDGNTVIASFATETGDKRYLEGVVMDDVFKVSRFDGSSLQLFTAEIKGDNLVNGVFISGKGGNYMWNGVYNPNAALRDPEKLTFLKDKNASIDFNLLNLEQGKTSLSDAKFDNKVKIIQITGTWCPNCLDETRYFTELYSSYNKQGLEIIAVAFENGNDTLKVLEKLTRYKNNNNIDYTILYGGKSGNGDAEAVFSMLNKVMSFPTAIYLDKNNNVRKIYTGFYGPGTGELYDDYTAKNKVFLEALLSE